MVAYWAFTQHEGNQPQRLGAVKTISLMFFSLCISLLIPTRSFKFSVMTGILFKCSVDDCPHHSARGSAPVTHPISLRVDDKGLLVDEALNIIGIIDWQMTCVVLEREAFGS